MAKIFAIDREFLGDIPDTGPIFTAKCPQCNDEIRVAEYGYWESICSCGYEFELNISITAIKPQH